MKRVVVMVMCASVLALAADTKLGKPLTLKEAIPVEQLLAKLDAHVGKTVQVKGKVSEVCQMAGCWMMITDAATGKGIRIKVNDGEIVFPKTAMGKTAIAEGKLSRKEQTKEEAVAAAKHEAEEKGTKADVSKAKAGAVYQIDGTGAVILN